MGGDPRLNAVASLKRTQGGPGYEDRPEVIHGLMPWPH
mgnify:FL=1